MEGRKSDDIIYPDKENIIKRLNQEPADYAYGPMLIQINLLNR